MCIPATTSATKEQNTLRLRRYLTTTVCQGLGLDSMPEEEEETSGVGTAIKNRYKHWR